MQDVYRPRRTIDTMVDSSKSNDKHDISDNSNNESYIEITEDNNEDNNVGQKNVDWSSDITNIEKNTFSAPIMVPQKKSQKKMEKDEYDIYGALVAKKLRKMDEITRQYVMNKIDNLMFRAIIQSTSHKNVQLHLSQNTTLNYVQQPYSLPSQFQTSNYTQQSFPSSSQCPTFSHTTQPSSSNSSTSNCSTQIFLSLNNSTEALTKVIEDTLDYDGLNNQNYNIKFY